jgi:CTP-dependent riboflavin kinase
VPFLQTSGELRIARGKFSQLKDQAKENQIRKPIDSVFVNSQKQNLSVNTTKELATELKTSDQTASRIIQIQAKADEATKEKFAM